jgi:hypothetical protein
VQREERIGIGTRLPRGRLEQVRAERLIDGVGGGRECFVDFEMVFEVEQDCIAGVVCDPLRYRRELVSLEPFVGAAAVEL